MSKPRILGGSARGRELQTPTSGTRPTPAKLREAVFNSLQFRSGRFLDLFGGSGAMGLEAASRGWEVTTVELARRAAETIRGNARRLGLSIDVVQGDALAYARDHGDFDVVFASPPYTMPDLAGVYPAIVAAGPARSGGLYLLQHPASLQIDPETLPDWAAPRLRSYGNNSLTELAVPRVQ